MQVHCRGCCVFAPDFVRAHSAEYGISRNVGDFSQSRNLQSQQSLNVWLALLGLVWIPRNPCDWRGSRRGDKSCYLPLRVRLYPRSLQNSCGTTIAPSIDVGIHLRVAIVLFYMTAAFVPEDGTIRFADDVYGHDARLDAWLQAIEGDIR
jgi:hypothetical protein